MFRHRCVVLNIIVDLRFAAGELSVVNSAVHAIIIAARAGCVSAEIGRSVQKLTDLIISAEKT